MRSSHLRYSQISGFGKPFCRFGQWKSFFVQMIIFVRGEDLQLLQNTLIRSLHNPPVKCLQKCLQSVSQIHSFFPCGVVRTLWCEDPENKYRFPLLPSIIASLVIEKTLYFHVAFIMSLDLISQSSHNIWLNLDSTIRPFSLGHWELSRNEVI